MYTIKKLLNIIEKTIVYALLVFFVAFPAYMIYYNMVPTVKYDFNSYDEFKIYSPLYLVLLLQVKVQLVTWFLMKITIGINKT